MQKFFTFLKLVWNHKKISAAVIIVLLVAGFFGKRQFFPSIDGYEISEVKRGTVKEELILSGSVSADEDAKLTFPTGGEISWVGVKEGDTVKKVKLLQKSTLLL